MRAEGDPKAKLLWRVEPGVVGEIEDRDPSWCAFKTGPQKGFVKSERPLGRLRVRVG